LQVKLGSVMILVAVVASLSGNSWSPNQTSVTATTSNVTVQMGMGDFSLPIVDRNGFTGKSLTLSGFRGKVIALEFMAPWCPSCQQLVWFMEHLYDSYSSKGVVFIAVVVSWEVDLSHYKDVTIAQFLSTVTSSLTYVYDSEGTVADMYSISEVPTFFILSKSGALEQSYGRLEGVSAIEDHASDTFDAALGQSTGSVSTTPIGVPQLQSFWRYGLFTVPVIIALVLVFLVRRRSSKKKLAGTTAKQASSTTGRFCINCGKPIPTDAKFCPECGALAT